MGTYYITNMAEILDGGGVPDIVVLPGAETRSRSTGGYDPKIPAPVAIVAHHTAGGLLSGNLADALHGALNHESKPIDNLRIGRDCVAYVTACGASNTEGQGGPLGPYLPYADNLANPRCIGVEMDNNGVGEPWSDEMQDVILKVFVAVYTYGVLHWGWEREVPQHRCFSHFEWAPTRKIDPAGPSRWADMSDRYMRWRMDAFRADVRAGVAAALAPPPVVEPPTPPPVVPVSGTYPPGSRDVMIPIDYGIAGTDSWWTEMAITPKGLQWSGGPSVESQKIRQIFVAVPMPRAPRLQNDADVIALMRAIGTFGDCPSTFLHNVGLREAWTANLNVGR